VSRDAFARRLFVPTTTVTVVRPSTRSEQRESGIVVKLRVRSGESIQDAVRRFRKLCERSGLRKEMRRKAYYEKPSERRRREELKRLRKARQANRV
jgi:small subunit ribosomal protein S21